MHVSEVPAESHPINSTGSPHQIYCSQYVGDGAQRPRNTIEGNTVIRTSRLNFFYGSSLEA